MIPVKDDAPTRTTPVINYVLIGLNVLVFIWMLTLSETTLEEVFYRFAMTPSHFADGDVSLEDIVTLFTSMFMHGGLAHLVGNMIYLWIFGDNVEDRLGHGQYLVFYLVGGLVASLTHMATSWGSDIPTVGASGAISAVLGAYIVMFPGNRIATFIPLGFFYHLTWVPAAVVLGLWFLFQFLDGLNVMGGGDAGGVAVWAHIGGFVAGVIMAKLAPSSRSTDRAITF